MTGREEVVQFLTKKWAKENGYRLRKELFAFTDNKIAVQVGFTSLSLSPPVAEPADSASRYCCIVLVRVV